MDGIAVVTAHVEKHGSNIVELTCVRCGCTDSRACEGGCFWIMKAPAICSRCYTVAGLLEAIR